ncbi:MULTISPECIES: hypothetical protein [unclassified Rhizobium]|nr:MULTISPECIES: hypothetical protein [unclassified Rhizobium]
MKGEIRNFLIGPAELLEELDEEEIEHVVRGIFWAVSGRPGRRDT